jgi:hypothetical protein
MDRRQGHEGIRPSIVRLKGGGSRDADKRGYKKAAKRGKLPSEGKDQSKLEDELQFWRGVM